MRWVAYEVGGLGVWGFLWVEGRMFWWCLFFDMIFCLIFHFITNFFSYHFDTIIFYFIIININFFSLYY